MRYGVYLIAMTILVTIIVIRHVILLWVAIINVVIRVPISLAATLSQIGILIRIVSQPRSALYTTRPKARLSNLETIFRYLHIKAAYSVTMNIFRKILFSF